MIHFYWKHLILHLLKTTQPGNLDYRILYICNKHRNSVQCLTIRESTYTKYISLKSQFFLLIVIRFMFNFDMTRQTNDSNGPVFTANTQKLHKFINSKVNVTYNFILYQFMDFKDPLKKL